MLKISEKIGKFEEVQIIQRNFNIFKKIRNVETI